MVTYRVPHVFLDEETTRLRRPHLEGGRRAWEWGAIRVEPNGTTRVLHCFTSLADLRLHTLLPAELQNSFRDEEGLLNDDGYAHLPEDVQKALEIGQFHARHPQRGGLEVAPVLAEKEIAARLAEEWLTDRPVLVGLCPNFDEAGLFDLLHRHGVMGADEEVWDYHLVDAATCAAGYLGWSAPYRTVDLARALNVDVEQFRAHTAVGDATLTKALYEAVLELRGVEP